MVYKDNVKPFLSPNPLIVIYSVGQTIAFLHEKKKNKGAKNPTKQNKKLPPNSLCSKLFQHPIIHCTKTLAVWLNFYTKGHYLVFTKGNKGKIHSILLLQKVTAYKFPKEKC